MPEASAANRRQLIPFAAVSATYFAHIGFFNPYLTLWLKDLEEFLQSWDAYSKSRITESVSVTKSVDTVQKRKPKVAKK
jgi:hypothetical protein